MSKIAILTLLIALACADAAAEQPSIVQHITASGNITIEQPEALAKLVERPQTAVSADDTELSGSAETPAPAHATTRTGYRVQVFDDNNPRTARSQAEAAMAELRHAFPSMAAYMRIVRDKINTFD